MQLPKIFKFTDLFYNKILPRIDNTPLTVDDLFLIEYNRIFSRSADPTGLPNMDRAGLLTQRHRFVNNTPPVLLPTDLPLEQIIINRCSELLNEGKVIKFFWSGGIDSTMVLAWLMELAPSRDQLEIFYTCDSIKTNPEFVSEIMVRDFRVTLWSDGWEKLISKDHIILTGMSADQLTASLDISFYQDYVDWIFKPWVDFFQYLGKSFDFIEKCSSLFSQCPVEIQTVLDARWWFYFYVRYDYWLARDWEKNLENFGTGNSKCFFDCTEFNSWSMYNKHLILGDRYDTYKQVFKDQTYKLWPNEKIKNELVKTDGINPLFWSKKKIALHNQQYLFMYLDSDNKPALFRTENLPFVNMIDIRQSIEKLNAT